MAGRMKVVNKIRVSLVVGFLIGLVSLIPMGGFPAVITAAIALGIVMVMASNWLADR